ncbi:MAG: amino acid ABC transporter substrate-binding protein [Candidatus Aminicenantes bacterium]|nr:MAG: amino acid ABC transporter substrate-binding protein [Candidatus Aminicenantes bacterium]
MNRWNSKKRVFFCSSLIILLMFMISFFLVLNYFIYDQKKKYKIAIIYNDLRIKKGDEETFEFPIKVKIRKLIEDKVKKVNQKGGINGTDIEVSILCDKTDPQELKRLINETISDNNLIAYLGCWSSTQGNYIVEQIGQSKIPFVSFFSVKELFFKHDNIYTMEPDFSNELLVFEQLLRSSQRKIAFIYIDNDLYSEKYLEKIKEVQKKDGNCTLVFEKCYDRDCIMHQDDFLQIYNALQNNGANFLILSLGYPNTPKLISTLRAKGFKCPVFTAIGNMNTVLSMFLKNSSVDPGELYDIGYSIPDIHNITFHEKIKEKKQDYHMESIVGYKYPDAIGLIVEAAKKGLPLTSGNIRKAVNVGLKMYINSKNLYRGVYSDLHFTKERVNANNALIVWRAPSTSCEETNINKYPILAPEQFIFTKNSKLRKIPVVYLQIQMVRLDKINSGEKTFHAEFNLYFEVKSAEHDLTLSFRDILFTNAVSESELKVTEYSASPGSYKVSGKFNYSQSSLRSSFLSLQKLYISVRPRKLLSFIIQPTLVSRPIEIGIENDWKFCHQYVGTKKEITKRKDVESGELLTTAIDNIDYVYAVKMSHNALIRILAPILLILIVTYFSVFIPAKDIASILAIQVTVLLATIAIYFTVYNSWKWQKSLLDDIFAYTYSMLIILLVSSVIIHLIPKNKLKLRKKVQKFQRYIYPFACIILGIYFLFC